MNDNQTEELVNAILMIEQHLSTMSQAMTELLSMAQTEAEL
jgi:hypothetical protein|tara:strand:- start:201 stop:323 length:123 start_codon:yes stop_codon:yes gene_type:complete